MVEETLGGSLADGDATSSAKQRIELWGRRVGRILAVIFAIYLVIMLAEHFTR